MKMWSMKVIILLLFCYACLSTDNDKVKFVSRNFNNVLHWKPATPAFPEENITYSVQYWSDAENQQTLMKEGCQNITALSCDLTAETPSVHDVHYWARVLVNGHFYGQTQRFKPIAETSLGPPTLSTSITGSSLYVNVSLPLGPNMVSITDIITKSKNGPSKTVALYTLKITHPKWAAQVHSNPTGRFIISLKNTEKEYCGYVVYKPYTEWGRSESENATFCVAQPDKDNGQGDPLHLPWLLLGAGLLAAIVIMSLVCVWKYVKGGKEISMPQPLVTTSSNPSRVLQSPDKNLIISKLELCTKDDQTVYAKIQMRPSVPSVGVGGYSPQDIPFQSWQGSIGSGTQNITPHPEDTSAQSSEIYSVVAVHAVEEDFQQGTIKDTETSNLPQSSTGESCDKGGMSPKLISHGVSPLLDPCRSNQTSSVPLHTVRVMNGQLMLPSFTFQLESSTSDAQRKPLLSDLIDSKDDGPLFASLQSFDGSEWSDSGCESIITTPTHPYCNTHYCPSKPVVHDFHQSTPSNDGALESGYKQNWIPAMLLETTSNSSREYRWTNHPWTWTCPKQEEEGEEEEGSGGEEILRKNLLGGWGVQIQE